MMQPEVLQERLVDEIKALQELQLIRKLKPWEQKRLHQMEHMIYLLIAWRTSGIRCPCCCTVGMIHAHRAKCAICDRFFWFDPFKPEMHQPLQPGLVADYWQGRPKTFLQILKGDLEDNGDKTRTNKRKRSSSVIQQRDFNFTGGNSETN